MKKLGLLVLMLLLFAGTVCADTSRVTFTNRKTKAINLYVRKDVEAASIESPPDPNTRFSFHLLLDGRAKKNQEYYLQNDIGRLYNYASGLTNTKRDEAEIELKTDANGTFFLQDGQIAVFEGMEQDAMYEIVEDQISDFTQIVPAGGLSAKGILTEEGAYVRFRNRYEIEPDIEIDDAFTNIHITKNVTWPQGYTVPETGFYTFTLKIDNEAWANREGYAVKDGTTRTVTTNASGQFQIKAGEEAVFESIPIGVDYEVTENGTPISSQNTQGATRAGGSFATFTNKLASFIVKKDVTASNDTEDFTFTLTNNSGTALARNYVVYDQSGNIIRTGVSTNGKFTLKSTQTAIFYDVSDPIISVKEDGKTGYAQTSPTKRAGYENIQLTDSPITLPFINARTDVADLTIKKTINGSATEKQNEFRFTVTLANDAINLLDSYNCTYRGATTLRTLADGTYTFTLKDNETFVIHGLPVGTTYSVREDEVANIYQKKENDTGTLTENKTAQFTNTYTRTLKVQKTVTGPGADTTLAFPFTLTLTSDHPDETPFKKGTTTGTFTGNTYEFTLKHNENIEFTIPVGVTYAVTEGETTDYETTSTNASGTITNNVTASFQNERIRRACKLIIRCIIDQAYNPYEDISFMYDVTGRDADNNPVSFTLLLTPNRNVTAAIISGYTSPGLSVGKSKYNEGYILTIPPGQYTVTQRKPQRYKLNEAKGNRPGSTVTNLVGSVNLIDNEIGELTFVNILTRWNMFSSASAETNHAGPAYVDPTI